MSKMNKYLTGILAVQIALIFVVRAGGSSSTIAPEEPLLADFDRDSVTRIEIESPAADGDTPETVVLDQKDGRWQVTSHFGYAADETKIIEIIGKIATLRVRLPIATSRTRHAQLGVADDDFQRKVTVTRADQKTVLYVGNPAGGQRTAIRLGGSDDVYAVSGLSMGGVQSRVGSWIDTTYFKIEEDKITRISISNSHGSFDFERNADSQWQAPAASEGAEPAAAPSTLTDAIKAAADIKIREPADPGRTSASPDVTVAVQVGGDAEGPGEEYVLDISANDDDTYFLKERSSTQAGTVTSFEVKKLVDFDGTEPPAAENPPGMMPPGGMPPGMMPPGGMPQMPGGMPAPPMAPPAPSPH